MQATADTIDDLTDVSKGSTSRTGPITAVMDTSSGEDIDVTTHLYVVKVGGANILLWQDRAVSHDPGEDALIEFPKAEVIQPGYSINGSVIDYISLGDATLAQVEKAKEKVVEYLSSMYSDINFNGYVVSGQPEKVTNNLARVVQEDLSSFQVTTHPLQLSIDVGRKLKKQVPEALEDQVWGVYCTQGTDLRDEENRHFGDQIQIGIGIKPHYFVFATSNHPGKVFVNANMTHTDPELARQLPGAVKLQEHLNSAGYEIEATTTRSE